MCGPDRLPYESVLRIKKQIVFCFLPQEPEASLHVPNTRAECLLKFQFRPVMEWQRWDRPSVPPGWHQLVFFFCYFHVSCVLILSPFRDLIPTCNTDHFVKEASEIPNFLQEVDKCRNFWSSGSERSGEFCSRNWNLKSELRRFTAAIAKCFLQRDEKNGTQRWFFWEQDRPFRWRSGTWAEL